MKFTLPDNLIEYATEFLLNPTDLYNNHVTVCKMFQEDGSVLWAIFSFGKQVWNKKEKAFVYNPSPSNRNKTYYRQCRFPSLEKAWKEGMIAVDSIRANNHDFLTLMEKAKELQANGELDLHA